MKNDREFGLLFHIELPNICLILLLLSNSNCIEYLYITDLFIIININIDAEHKNLIMNIHNQFLLAILNRFAKLDSQKPKRFHKNTYFVLTNNLTCCVDKLQSDFQLRSHTPQPI